MLIKIFLSILIVNVFILEIDSKEIDSPLPVFGYLPEYRLQNKFDYDGLFSMGLTHLIYFSLEIDPSTGLPSALDRLPPLDDIRRARTAADRFGGKLMLSFGGNGRSAGFSYMVATKKRRRKFIEQLNLLIEEYSIDGVDYNWEYPSTANEWSNWGLLMKESKDLLITDSKDTFQPNIVTFTMYMNAQHYSVIQHFGLLRDADYVHCMAYDSSGKHSTIEFAMQAIEFAQSTPGFDASKFVLGLPFYGRNIQTGEPKAYYDIIQSIKNKEDFRKAGDVVNDVFYNSGPTLMAKVKAAHSAGIGGVMIWELGQDVQPFNRSDSLMRAIHSELLLHGAVSDLSQKEL
mmetsp:Transcript_34351/g.49942  ORF Transcript_34351/g.49942 Transcript_34351/m.49942 type:complete len:345 (-) Transcript_34351:57-1091(-)